MRLNLSVWIVASCMTLACASPTLRMPDTGTANVDAAGGGGDAVSDEETNLPADASGTVDSPDAGFGTALADVPSDAPLVVDATDSADKDAVGQADVGPLCPKAVVTLGQAPPFIPQSQVKLIGDKSVSANGSPVKSYHWTAKQPAGSTSVLVPSATFPNPTFQMNVAGAYTFCLTVWDAQGVMSCQLTCLTLLVLPDEALHIELTWDTPNDPDQTDTGPGAGADMDLHFAHQMAAGPDIDCDGQPDPWFSNPFDAFWFNPNPNWGAANPPGLNNPSLDLDDTDGAGPENLNMSDPEGTPNSPKNYAIGVHYWSDQGFGVSTPTVRVYVLGALVATLKGPPMNANDFWYVAQLNWPNSASTTASTVVPLTLCYQSASPCLKNNPGKMWIATGNHCVCPCYIKPGFSTPPSGSSASGCVVP
ncbi:MAG: hypothetical protein KC502_08150 [Myxococcales bacterium]|nr:hypothetical protein [Myxococcales bacterium]